MVTDGARHASPPGAGSEPDVMERKPVAAAVAKAPAPELEQYDDEAPL